MLFFPPREKFHSTMTSYLKKIGLCIQVLLFHKMKLFLFHLECLWCKPSSTSIHLPSSQLSKIRKGRKMIFSDFFSFWFFYCIWDLFNQFRYIYTFLAKLLSPALSDSWGVFIFQELGRKRALFSCMLIVLPVRCSLN
jgi:hypothetical protein